MRSTIGWILAIVFGLLLVLILVLSGLWMFGRFGMGGYGGMMGWRGMMGGYNFMHLFGWGGMVFGWLISVGIIILLIVGVVALVNSLNKSGKQAPPQVMPGRTCSNCGKPAQSDWSTCPYCGQKLS